MLTAKRLFLAALAFAAFSTAAYAVDINCPLSQARRTITNDLPDGWWTTPYIGSLSETKIQEIGGKPALVCVYGASGSVQRNAPDNHNCSTISGGFRCTPTLVAIPPRIELPGGLPTIVLAPQTHTTGPIDVPQTYLFDLDQGNVTRDGADLWFQAETADLLYLAPRNGARIAVGDRSNRGYAGCREARFVTDRVSLADIPVGSYVCVKTNEGRISQFRLNNVEGGSPKTLKLGYTTWK